MTAPDPPAALLRRCFETAVAAAQPETYLPASGLIDRLRALPPGVRCHIFGAGKGSAAMAAALEAMWPRATPPRGLVVTRDGYRRPTAHIEVREAGHPFPDRRNLAAVDALEAYLATLGAGDHIVMLVSGGGSSLLSHPVAGVTLDQHVALVRALMDRGVAVGGLNIVRKHLSSLLGGKLALRARGMPIDAIILSDVVGDDPADIASGPVTADPSTLADARAIIAAAGVTLPDTIRTALSAPANETPKPGDPVFAHVREHVVPADCWIAPVTTLLEAAGYRVTVIDTHAEGDSRAVAGRHAALARAAAAKGGLQALLSGGELTARPADGGEGGPNCDYALALGVALEGDPRIHAIACDTDGTDGSTDAAGAVVAPDLLAQAAAIGLSPTDALARSDSGRFFKRLGLAVMSGPTYTNVNDMRVMLVDPHP